MIVTDAPWPLHTCTTCRVLHAERPTPSSVACTSSHTVNGQTYQCDAVSPAHPFHTAYLYAPDRPGRERAIVWDEPR